MMYKPIYIVGYPHGGCTLLRNMLRENENIYTITGTKKETKKTKRFGSGSEGHNSLFNIIPETLRNPDGKGGPCWQYGWDEQIDHHHLTEKDVKLEDAEQYLSVMEDIKREFNVSNTMRFLDKSQPYLVKTRYIQKILFPADVYFIYVIRNPYVLCYKPFKWNMYGKEKRIKAFEQVANTYNCFVNDSEYLKHFKIIKFEDVVLSTRRTLKKLCNILELNFEEDMTPHKESTIESNLKPKFYPLKTDVVYDDGRNRFGNKELDGMITEKCADIIESFNYSIP